MKYFFSILFFTGLLFVGCSTEEIVELQPEAIIDFPFEDNYGCGCIVRPFPGPWYIVAVDCDDKCPDGSDPIPGLGY